MAIGFKETQEIIRKASALSRNASVPAKLEPLEVGMATGPRQRNRALMRPGTAADYLDPAETKIDEWQKLDDDIYKFLQLRKDQFGRLGSPPSHQFIAEMEAQLKFNEPAYALGAYLGLLRQAADLDQTRQTFVTASEKGAFHAFARRLTQGRKDGDVFDPSMVKRYLDLLDTNHPTTFRGLADLFRLISRAARQPLIGGVREAPSLSISVTLQVVDLAARFNQQSAGRLEFQVSPMDVFLGARTVLFNRSVTNPTMSMVKELVLDDTGLYHEDLVEWLRSVGTFGSELTLLMPDSLTAEGFALQGGTYSAVELVMAAGAKLSRAEVSVERALETLSDALVHKIQQQDAHKDQQIQSILGHFNQLLQGERRSAARVTQDRQQARFDYITAIQRASQLAKGMKTTQMPALSALTAPQDESTQAFQLPPPGLPAAAVIAGISVEEYENQLSAWDGLLGRIRKKLSAKSPVFKSLASQLSKVRALDTCMAFGLTPSGGRCANRLARLLQSEEVRVRLGLPIPVAEAIQEAFGMDYLVFQASLECLVESLYNFQPDFKTSRFRLRDRKPDSRMGLVAGREGLDGRDTIHFSDGGGIDEVLIKIFLGTLFLGHEMMTTRGKGTVAQFDLDGSLRFPSSESLSTLGYSDPFLTYCAFLWASKQTLMQAPIDDLETALTLMSRLTPEWRHAMVRKYAEISGSFKSSRLIPRPRNLELRTGWVSGCEKGFMSEVKGVYEQSQGASGLEARLLELLTDIQPTVDKACEALESEKLRLTREWVLLILG